MSLLVGELFVKLNLDSSNFSKLLAQAKKELQTLAKNNLTLKARIDIDNNPLNAAKTSIGGLLQSLAQTRSSAQMAGRSFFDLGNIIRNALSYTVGIGITNVIRNVASAIGSVIPTAAAFEKQMSGVKAVLQASDSEFDALREKALQLGRDTKFSSAEAAEGIEMLAKNGLSASQILNGAIDSALALAAATGTDLATASDIATDVMQQFGLTADQLPEAINTITGAVNGSKFSIDDYRLAIGQAGGVAALTGTSLEDFNAVLTATSSRFNGGSDAGTSFKQFLLSLVPNSENAKTAMQELGIITEDGKNKFFDAEGQMKSMDEILVILHDTFGKLSPEMQETFGKAIFGRDSIRTLNGLLETSVERWNNIKQSFSETDAVEQAIIRVDNLSGLMEILSSSIETVSIRLGDSFLPAAKEFVKSLIDIVNTAETIIQALQGSQEAFNELSPAIQTAIIIVQEASSYFSELAGAALEWGQNIGSSFASGIIDAASVVIDALMEMGSWIEYWLAPGSPPRVAPNLDQWGASVAQVYFDSFGDADTSVIKDSVGSMISDVFQLDTDDLKSLKDFTSQIQSYLGGLFGDSTQGKLSAIETVIGTKEAFANALSEIRQTGSISKSTFDKIITSAGKAGDSIGKLVTLYLQQQRAIKDTAYAQEKLNRAQDTLDQLKRAKEAALAPLEAALDAIKAKKRINEIDKDIAKNNALINSIGADAADVEIARADNQELALEKQILLTEQAHAAGIDQAEQQVSTAEVELKHAKEKEDLINAQIALEQDRMAAITEQNDLVREQIDLIKKLAEEQAKANEAKAGGTKKSQADKDAEAAAKAQEEYNLQVADTAGKLAIYRAKLGTVQEGSAEYYDILGEIDKLEKKQQQEQQKAADQEAKEKEKQLKAQQDYEYSIADTAGKLDILHKRLGTVQEGSEEYYDILKQIHDVEQQQNKEREQAARKGRSGGGSLPSLDTTDKTGKTPEGDATKKTVEDVRKTFEDIKEKAEQARVTFIKFQENVANARKEIDKFLSPVKEAGANIQQFLVPALAALATPAIIGAITGIVVALTGLLSPITLISLAVGVLVYAWQQNFGNIQGIVAQAWVYIQSIFTSIATILQTFWQEHGSGFTSSLSYMWEQVQTIFATLRDFILSMLQGTSTSLNKYSASWSEILWGAWKIISGIISGALTVIQGILDVFIGLATGNWKSMWKGLNEITEGLIQAIKHIIEGTLTIIAGLFGTTYEDIEKTWNKLWEIVKITVQEAVDYVYTTIQTWKTNLDTAFLNFVTAQQIRWTNFWRDITATVTREVKDIITKISTWKTDMDTRFNTFIADQKTRWTNFWRDITATVSREISSILTIIDTFKTDFLTRIANLFTDLHKKWDAGVNYLVTKISTIKDDIIELLTNQEALDTFFGALVIVGTNIVDGIVKGIKDGAGKVFDAISDIVSGGKDQANKTSQSSSPSKLYAEAASYWPAGMVVGINEGAYDVFNAVKRLTLDAANATIGPMNTATLATAPIVNNYNFNIDARGSTMTEAQMRKIIRDEMNLAAETAKNRRRL